MNTKVYITEKERFIFRANAIIKGYVELKEIWRAVELTAKQMNGKVFNKRFADSVNEKTALKFGRIWFSDTYNLGYKSMTLSINSRCYQIPNQCGVNYIDDYLYSKSLHNAEKELLTDGRIDEEKAISTVSAYIAVIDRERQKYLDAIKHYDRDTERREKALQNLAKAFEKINPLFVPTSLQKYDWEKMTNKK